MPTFKQPTNQQQKNQQYDLYLEYVDIYLFLT